MPISLLLSPLGMLASS